MRTTPRHLYFSWRQCNTQKFVFAWVVSVTAMGLQVNLAKHKQKYFQNQNLKASVPKCSKVISEINCVTDKGHTNDSKSLLSLPLSSVVQKGTDGSTRKQAKWHINVQSWNPLTLFFSQFHWHHCYLWRCFHCGKHSSVAGVC